MKLIIDIPEQIWEMVVNTGTFGCYRFNTSRAIRKGVLLDEIRAEIWDLQYGDEEKSMTDEDRAEAYNNAIIQAIEIIDKYKAESEIRNDTYRV